MSTPLSSVDLSDSPEEPEATPQKPQRSRWVGLLLLLAIVLLCGVGAILFERQTLTQRVAELEARLEESQDETRAVVARLSRESTRVEDLRSTMGEINQVSAELVQRLTSLRTLTSDALANSATTGASPAEIPEAPIAEEVEEFEEVEAVEEVAEAEELEESVPSEVASSADAASEEPAPARTGLRGTPAIGVMRPISPEFR